VDPALYSPKAFRGCPDDQRKEDANDIRETTEKTENQTDGDGSFTQRDKSGKHMRIHADKVDPEMNPCLDKTRLPIESASQVLRQIIAKRRLPLEPGIKGQDQTKDDT